MELCDETGRVLGMFIPAVDYAAVERARPPISHDELDRRNRSASFTTAKILARLEKSIEPPYAPSFDTNRPAIS